MKARSADVLLSPCRNSGKGFTLLEVIVTIVVAAIMGALLVQFMGTSMIQSARPVTQVQQVCSLNAVMEQIAADHKKLLAEDSAPLEALKANIENNNYGGYSCQTGYIRFAGGDEVADLTGSDRVLKVRITSGDQVLTSLFTK